MLNDANLSGALADFAEAVSNKTSQLASGEPEDQLRGPFENFIAAAARTLDREIVCTGETPLPDRLGRPDFAIHLNKLLAGYVELKAPGVGADVKRFKSRNREQWKRFQFIPNLIYCDGNEWALYRGGALVERVVRLSGDIVAEGARAVAPRDAPAVERLLRDFLTWNPTIPTGRNGKIDLKGFAEMLAPLCRMLRDDVADALRDSASPLVQLAKDWRQLLFPDASDAQFADAYAQTVAFALLLGRGEGADPLTLESAQRALAAQHSLLSRALQVLTDPAVRVDMSASLDLLTRVIAVVPRATLSDPEDPWLYFYEDFLAAYDPKLRKDAGTYYTPVEVVRAQVRLIDDVLTRRLRKRWGFADPGVVTLDPAAGTGTYLLGVIEHALRRVEAEQGAGAVPGHATALAANLFGFEQMVGPYAVAELRTTRALRDRGGALPPEGSRIYLTDTLESPHAQPPQLPLFLRPIAEQHARAIEVKSKASVIVCLGNPPYDRHEAAGKNNQVRTGGWVRWGDAGEEAIFRDFADPVVKAGLGVHLKNLYNLYVYFWRWALWKVFEHESSSGQGLVSFISASSYLGGEAFGGMREHMRRVCDEIWILDLGGEGRGTRRDENVFDIQTPVAVAVAVRLRKSHSAKPAAVRYCRIEGDRKQKLAALDAIRRFEDVEWRDCPSGWRDPFQPAGRGPYFDWPLLTDLMPWQHSGAQLKRTWPICVEPETLTRRWRALLTAPDRAVAFRETRDRKISSECAPLWNSETEKTPIVQLSTEAEAPLIRRYAYRTFDRQWVFADSRMGDYFRPHLWRAHGERQIYLTTLLNHPLGKGPALTACACVPDLDHFRGSFGAKQVCPLYRDADAETPNISPGLLELLAEAYGREMTPEDFIAYLYGALAHPAYTERFAAELETRQLRVPLTKNAALFAQVRDLGARLLWLHAYGERLVPDGELPGVVPRGAARCVKPIPGDPEGYPASFEYDGAGRTLRVGAGEFQPVAREVFEFEVSGLKVVQSWLKYRLRNGGGKKSSPLDDIRPERWTSQFTNELLDLLWVLEATIAVYPRQAELSAAVAEGPCFSADELPTPPDHMRKPSVSRPLLVMLGRFCEKEQEGVKMFLNGDQTEAEETEHDPDRQ